MKASAWALFIAVALPPILSGGAGRAADPAAGSQVASTPAFEAKVRYCKTCHGPSGQGYRGSIVVPRLAGQQPEYFENQLRAFIEKRRDNPYMYSVSHVLSPDMLAALSAHFKALNPKPLERATPDIIATGKTLYEKGTKDAPPCAACHQPDGKGDGQFPRLAGQLQSYVFNKLVNWNKERGQDPKKPDSSAIMQPIAHSLTDTEIKAIAAYVSTLE